MKYKSVDKCVDVHVADTTVRPQAWPPPQASVTQVGTVRVVQRRLSPAAASVSRATSARGEVLPRRRAPLGCTVTAMSWESPLATAQLAITACWAPPQPHQQMEWKVSGLIWISSAY